MITDYFERSESGNGQQEGVTPQPMQSRGPVHPYAMADGHKVFVDAQNLPQLLAARNRKQLTCINVNCNKQLAVHNGPIKRLHCQHAPGAKATARSTGEEALTCTESFEHFFVKNVAALHPQLLEISYLCACCRRQCTYDVPSHKGVVERPLVLNDSTYRIDVWYSDQCALEVVKTHRLSCTKYMALGRANLHFPEVHASTIFKAIEGFVGEDVLFKDIPTVVASLRKASLRIPVSDLSGTLRVCGRCRDAHKTVFVTSTHLMWRRDPEKDCGCKFFKGFAPYGEYESLEMENGKRYIHVVRVGDISEVVDTERFDCHAMAVADVKRALLPPELRYSRQYKHAFFNIVDRFAGKPIFTGIDDWVQVM